MRYWIKLYTEIVHDPKMGRLTDRQFRTCINLFALAGEIDQEGALPEIDDMAWRLRMSPEDLSTDLAALAAVNIVTDDDGWLICKWAERQSRAPSAAPDKVLQRVHEHRERKRNDTPAARNEDVTTLHPEVKRDVTPPEKRREEKKRIEEKRAETETDDTSTAAIEPHVAAAFQAWRTFGVMISGPEQSGEMLERIDALHVKDVDAWWALAIKRAGDANKRNWAYVRGILDSCLTSGLAPGIFAGTAHGGNGNGVPQESNIDAAIRLSNERLARQAAEAT